MIDALYRRTDEGRAAFERSGLELEERYRELLGCIGDLTAFEEISRALAHRSPEELAPCLEDLEAIGLVESVSLEWLVELYLLARYEATPA